MAAITGRPDGSIIIDTRINTAGFGKGVAGLKSQFQGLSKATGKLGMIIAAAFSVKTIVAFSKEAIKLGSDLQEVQNVVDVVFTTMNEQINEFAKNAAMTAGLSETMAKKYAGTFGAMAKSFKFSEKEAYNMATALTQLSGDVASFYNITQDEAYTKLKSVFTGETESLKELGVVMTQTALDDFAFRKGIGKTVDKMTEQEKVALRYQFVLEQLSAASGDFVRTQDGWANQTRVLNLQFDQLKATIGQGLINILTPVLKLVNDLIARFQVLADSFKSFTETIFGNAGKGAGAVIESVTDSTDGLGDSVEEAGKKAKKFLAPFDEIVRLGSDDKKSSQNSEPGGTSQPPGVTVPINPDFSDNITPKIEKIVTKIKKLFQDFTDKIKSLYGPAITSWGQAFQSILPAVWSTADQIGLIFGDLWESSLVPFGNYILFDFVPSIVNTFSTNFAPVFASVLPHALEAAARIATSASGTISKALLFVQDSLDRVKRMTAVFSETFAPIFGDILPVAADTFATNFENNALIMEEALGWLNEGFSKVEKFFNDMCLSIKENWDKYGGDLLNEFEKFVDNAWDTWWKFYGKIIKPVLDKVSEAIDQVWEESLKPLWDSIVEFVFSVGKDILRLYNNVLKPVIDWLVDFWEQNLSPIFDWIIRAVKDAVWVVSDYLGGFFDDVRYWFNGIIDFLSGVFTGDWELAWQGIVGVFSSIWSSIENTIKTVVNAIIWLVNQMISFVYTGVVNLVNSIGGIVGDLGSIFGQDWGFAVPTAPPQIEYITDIPFLAKGTVIPPNAPFMAVLGDQRHGTNIEAPLSTIQEAVDAVMESKFSDMMDGFAETVAVLREILEAVYGIQIGDDVLGQAVDRYNRKMNIARGGVL